MAFANDAFGEEAHPFEYRTITQLVRIFDNAVGIEMSALEVFSETVGDVLNPSAGPRIRQHVDNCFCRVVNEEFRFLLPHCLRAKMRFGRSVRHDERDVVHHRVTFGNGSAS